MSIRSSSTVPFAYPFLGQEEEEAVIRVLRSGWLTTGKEALSFEKEFASFLDPNGDRALRAYAVNSATSGLHLALEACGVGPGDVVLTCPYTFTATAEVVRYLGADVAFVDSEKGAFNIDPGALDRTIERLSRGLRAYPGRSAHNVEGFGPRGRPAAVIPVHFAGLPCDMEAIRAVARRYGTRIVEDAAHAFPSAMGNGEWAGTIGDAGVFSFYATKTITTGEGGMVVTADQELGNRVSIMRSHGIDRAVWDRYTDRRASWRYAVVEAGFKYNIPDVLAAIGREQLKKATSLLAMRQELAQQYDAAFSDDDRVIVPPTGPADARHLYPLRLASAANRDAVIEFLQDAGVGVSVHFIPLHLMPYYADRYALVPEDFPEALARFSAEISLPLWPGMTSEQTDKVIDAVRAALRSAGAAK